MKLSAKKWIALILVMLYGLLIAAGGMIWTFVVYADSEGDVNDLSSPGTTCGRDRRNSSSVFVNRLIYKDDFIRPFFRLLE